MMSRHKNSGKVLTILLLHLSWTIHTQAFPTPQTQNLTATDIVSATGVNTTPSNSRLSDSELLELLYATYIVNIENATTRASEVRHTSLQPALLDYENLTDVANLEKDVTNSTDNETDLVLPPDVYEVPLSLWINGESANPDVPDKIEDTADGAEQVILDALRRSVESSDDHSIRHRGRRLADRNNRRVSEDSSALLPIDSVDPNILSLFQPQQDSEESTGSLDILRQRDKFNITVDYDATFHNIDSTKLIEIIAIMRTDCSEIPKRKKIVRWVLETRGILFECRNGAWVVTYLSRPQGKPRPRSVTGNHFYLEYAYLKGAFSDWLMSLLHTKQYFYEFHVFT